MEKWIKESISLYAKNAKPGLWDIKRCNDSEILSTIKKYAGTEDNYNKFIAMMEAYYDAERCPSGDYGTGNPHRDMEAEAYDSAWSFFRRTCNRLSVPSGEVENIIFSNR